MCRGRVDAAFLANDGRQAAKMEVATVVVKDGVGMEGNVVDDLSYWESASVLGE